MSEIKTKIIKRIFYFNITYGCNSNCIFCYSHNTHHNSISSNEISIQDFSKYLENKNISSKDRIIINGGEPLLHTNIIELLNYIKNYKCEKLIYTNGRLLSKIDLSTLDSSFRFIVPIHGYQKLHDSITQVDGSYKQTIEGLSNFKKNTNCKSDIKIILNKGMIQNKESFKKTLNSFDNIYFNNAVHLTKMADTIVSKKNNCKSLNNNEICYNMNKMFEYFLKRKCPIKLFDTCIKNFDWLNNYNFEKISENLEVYFKDFNQERQICLGKSNLKCTNTCDKKDYCISAVNQYKVLEFYKDKLYENLE